MGPRNWESENENKFSRITRSYFRVSFTYASFLLSESLEQAMDKINVSWEWLKSLVKIPDSWTSGKSAPEFSSLVVVRRAVWNKKAMTNFYRIYFPCESKSSRHWFLSYRKPVKRDENKNVKWSVFIFKIFCYLPITSMRELWSAWFRFRGRLRNACDSYKFNLQLQDLLN